MRFTDEGSERIEDGRIVGKFLDSLMKARRIARQGQSGVALALISKSTYEVVQVISSQKQMGEALTIRNHETEGLFRVSVMPEGASLQAGSAGLPAVSTVLGQAGGRGDEFWVAADDGFLMYEWTGKMSMLGGVIILTANMTPMGKTSAEACGVNVHLFNEEGSEVSWEDKFEDHSVDVHITSSRGNYEKSKSLNDQMKGLKNFLGSGNDGDGSQISQIVGSDYGEIVLSLTSILRGARQSGILAPALVMGSFFLDMMRSKELLDCATAGAIADGFAFDPGECMPRSVLLAAQSAIMAGLATSDTDEMGEGGGTRLKF